MTNNSAEYYGLIRALDALEAWPDAELTILADSELLVRQITGEYRVRSAQLAGLFEEAQRRLLRRDHWNIRHVRREHNSRADELANRAMDQESDIVVVDRRPGAETAPSDNGHKKAKKEKAPAPSVTSVACACTLPPNASICPAACKKGAAFEIAAAAPADLCMDALASMLHTVMALRQTPVDSEDATPPLTVRCFKTGCGAVFELKAVQP